MPLAFFKVRSAISFAGKRYDDVIDDGAAYVKLLRVAPTQDHVS